MNHANPSVSIVIRCYNEVDHIGNLLKEVFAQSYEGFEVVVVDSGSDDGTLELVQKFDVRLEHIRKEDFTFGRSLNQGCRAAKGQILVFVSAHCIPTSNDWLESLVRGFDDEKVAAVYGMQRGIPESHFSERQIFRRWFPEESTPRQEGPFCNNANCAIRKSLWEEYAYDEALTGLEDVAWASEMVRRGWWISYAAEGGVLHVHNESPAQIRNRYRREAITFQKVFPEEHFNLRTCVQLITSNVWADWSKARSESVWLKEFWNITRFRSAQFIGTYQGFRLRRPSPSELRQRFYYPTKEV